jgi:hypothetical protein
MSNEEYEQDAQSEGDDTAGQGEESFDSGEMGDAGFIGEQPKKPISKSTLVMMAIIAASIGGMYFMHQRAGMPTADAADPKATQVIKQFMSDKDKNSAQMQKMIKETQSVVDQFLNYPNLKQIPLTELSNNPFKMLPAKDDAADSEKARIKREQEERLAHEAQKNQIAKAANALNLQSIVVSGARKACMINNTLVMEGQTIEDGDKQFTVEKITRGVVTVKCGEYRFELTMRK